MKLGIMQPYFFPYIGYFSLINYTDKWVVFDNVQYIYHGWINRNRILHPSREKFQYIIAPLEKHSREAKINEVAISYSTEWKKRIIAQLEHYKKKAPYYKETIDLLKECFDNEEKYISGLNVKILKSVCCRLNINFDYRLFSEMDMDIEADEAGDWALKISERLNADEYVNPPGGKEIFDKNKFEEKGIKLKFLELDKIEYNQYNNSFIPYLSIIDVFMFNSISQIQSFLNIYKITE